MITILKKDEQWFVRERKRVGPTTIKVTTMKVTPMQAIQIRTLTGAQFEKEGTIGHQYYSKSVL